MSLANIRRLLQEDTVLCLPAITAHAHLHKKVVSIVAMQTCTTEDASIHVTQVCMLHVNTRGQVQWTHDLVAPETPLPAAWLRQNQLDETLLAKAPTWRLGWSAAVHHMAKHNLVVVAQVEDFVILNQQFLKAETPAPELVDALALRALFYARHPSKSSGINDMASYYQIYFDPEKHLKASVVTYAKLLDKMLAEKALPVTDIRSNVSSDLTIQDAYKTTDDARKWVVRAEAGANTALDFFTKIIEQFPFQLVLNQHGKIQGYSLLVNTAWVKGTQLGENLGWSQVCQDHHWRLDDSQMQAIAALQYKEGS